MSDKFKDVSAKPPEADKTKQPLGRADIPSKFAMIVLGDRTGHDGDPLPESYVQRILAM